jgi:Spy/CpxP family protein refolding chaperone
MKKSLVIVLAAMMLFVFSAMVSAEGKGCMEGMPMGGMMCGMMAGNMMMGPKMVLSMASELNLTADQMDKLKKVTDDMPDKGAKMDEMENNMKAMKEELQKDTPDEAKIDSMIDKMAEKHKAAIKNRIKTVQAVNGILTKEQKEILKKSMEDKKEKMGKGMGKMKANKRK